MREIVRCLAAVALLVGLPAYAWADWTRLRTANFLFIGDASDRQIRETARRLEQFRETMVRALPGANATSPVPTVVVVFQRDRSFTPFKPRFGGRVQDLAGYFLGREDINYILVNVEHGEAGFSTIFHEYSHFLMNNSMGGVPVWVSEGLAQFYESFEERDGGRVAIIGAPILEHVAQLRNSTLIPLRDLIAIDAHSSVYNEGSRRGVFYAQSWALVHYLLLGNDARTLQLVEYLSRLRSGSAPSQAFSEAFGDDPSVLERELRNYISQVSVTQLRFTLDERIDGTLPKRGEPIDTLDADVYLGDIQARIDRVEEARERLEKVLEKRPGTALATAALGLIEVRAERLNSALPLLERAAAEGPDDGFVQGALGSALVSRLGEQQSNSSDFAATLQRARTVLARAVALDPEGARAAALSGYAELVAGEDLERAAALLTRAANASPAREQYRLMLAQVFLQQRDYDRATAILGPLIAQGSRTEVREDAREILTRVAAARSRSARAAPAARPAVALASSDAAAAELPRDPAAGSPPGPSSETAATRNSTAGRRPFQIPALRPVAAGETRVLGTFLALVCERELTVLVVETNAGRLRLRRNQSRSPDFIAYVPNPPSQIACGAIEPPQRVLATYTAAARPAGSGFDGDAVAIELIPDDFTPP